MAANNSKRPSGRERRRTAVFAGYIDQYCDMTSDQNGDLVGHVLLRENKFAALLLN